MDLYKLACLQARLDLRERLPPAAKYIEGMDLHFSAPFKLIELWTMLVRYQPKTILEIGCGATTCVFAMYAKKYGAQVVSTEDKMEYFEKCDRKLGVLRHEIHMRYTPLIESDGALSHHTRLDGVAPDLLYVDGPATTKGELSGDARNIVASGTLPKLIMFDFRFATVKDFIERFSDLYAVEVGCAGSTLPWYLKTRHHSFAWRR